MPGPNSKKKKILTYWKMLRGPLRTSVAYEKYQTTLMALLTYFLYDPNICTRTVPAHSAQWMFCTTG